MNPSDDPRLSKFRSQFVTYPRVAEILGKLERYHSVAYSATTADCMFLLGESGSGKSRTVDHFCSTLLKKYSSEEIVDEHNGLRILPLPIVRAETPTRPTQRSVASAILTALGDPVGARENRDHIMDKAISRLKQRQTKLIVLEEVNHLVDRSKGRESVAYDAGDFIKSLLNWRVCPILLVGTPQVEMVTEANEQIIHRCRYIGRLEPLGYSTKEEQEDFQDILAGLEKRMGLPQASDLAEPEMARRIHAAGKGLFGRVFKLLDTALVNGIAMGQKRITRQMLGDIYAETMSSLNRAPNPFRSSDLPQVGAGPQRDTSRLTSMRGRGAPRPSLAQVLSR